jgi:hypothetical protein
MNHVSLCAARMPLFAILLGVIALGSPRAATLSHIAPLALVPGKTTMLTFSGSGLEKMSNLWSSAALTARRVLDTNSDQVRFEVGCPENARGIQAIQLYGPDGASNFKLVLIDGLRRQPNQDPHHSRTNAYCIKPPAAVDGSLKSEQVDYYVFGASAGEKLSIEAIAHRLGSEMDPVVRVYDGEGRELAVCDDEPGVWRDARFIFTAPSAGDYVLGVYDSAFGGGSNYDYRLRVTHEPLIWYTYPLANPSEVGALLEEFGAGTHEPAGSPANPTAGPIISAFPTSAELEPNDLTNQAQRLFLPAIVNGKINAPADIDYFRFTVGKEDRLIFQSATRSLGSPCDLVLALKSREGKILAQSDPALPSDAAVTNKFDQAGEYLLEIRELSGNSVSNAPYRVSVRPFENGIAASVEENRLEAALGGTVTLKVSCVRYEYNGPVRFEIEPPVSGVSLETNEIPEKKNSAELKIKISDQLKPGFCVHFKMKATAVEVAQDAFVSTGPALHKNFPLMLNPPPMLEDLFSLAVKGN